MSQHQVAYRMSDKQLIVSILEWRYRPLDARKSIQIFDYLKINHMVWRLENGVAVEASDPNDIYHAPKWPGMINHYEDGTAHLKEFV